MDVKTVSIGEIGETDKFNTRVSTECEGESSGALEIMDNADSSIPVGLVKAIEELHQLGDRVGDVRAGADCKVHQGANK